MSKEIPLGKDINLRFEVLENNGALLRVRYEAENVSTSDLYLFNRLWYNYTEHNFFELDANLVYISTQGSIVRLLKGSPDVPRNMSVEMPIIPCITLLPRSQRMNETFQITLPLRQVNPYLPEESNVIENPSAIIFSLGYFPVSQIGNRPVNPVRTTQGQALYAYVTPLAQLVVNSAPVPFSKGSVPTGKAKYCSKCGSPIQSDSHFCSQCGSPL